MISVLLFLAFGLTLFLLMYGNYIGDRLNDWRIRELKAELRRWENTGEPTKGGVNKMPRIFRWAWYAIWLTFLWRVVSNADHIAIFLLKVLGFQV